jgi:hypothetical protein
VDLIARLLIAPVSAFGIGAPAAVNPWTRPLPAMQQAMFPSIAPSGFRPQQAYLELMARRKVLYALPVVDMSVLLELIDGSGAPFLNAFVLPAAGAPGPLPTTPLAMTCPPQGTALRTFIMPLIGLPLGP